MCMEDYRIGRKTTSREVAVVTVISTAQMVLSGADNRVAVILGAPVAGSVTYSTNPKPTSGAGFVVGAGQPPLSFSVQVEGDIVRKQWWIVDDGTSRAVAVAETLLTDQ